MMPTRNLKPPTTDDDIAKSIGKYLDRESIGMSAYILALFVFIAYECMRFVPLLISDAKVGSAIGISPLIFSSMIHGISTVEFKVKDKGDVKLKSDALFTFIYTMWWYSNVTSSLFGAEILDAIVIVVFTLLTRYVDVVFAALTRNWISLIHASVCAHSLLDLTERIALGGLDTVCIVFGLVTTAFVVSYCTRAIPFGFTKSKNVRTAHTVPWLYNGTTSLIYADTCGGAIDAALDLVLDEDALLTAPVVSIVKCFIIVFFEFNLPRMQDRDAKGVISLMKSGQYALTGWRDTPASRRHVDRIINKSLPMRVPFMIGMKLCNLSSAVIIVEQFKTLRMSHLKNALRWTKRHKKV